MTQLDSWLWAVAGLGACWALAPAVLHFAGLARLRYVAERDPCALDSLRNDADYQRRIARLRELGFAPLGIVRETAWFHFGQWRTVFQVHCLATADGKCFASVYRLHPGEPVRLSFESFTTNRGLVRTVTPGVGDPHADQTFSRLELQGLNEAELLARHHEHVDAFVERTGLRIISQTLEGRTSTDEDHEGRQLASSGTAGFLVPFFVVPSVAVWLLLGPAGESISAMQGYALALCGGTLAYFIMMHFALPMLVRQSCCQDHEASIAS